MAIGLGELRGQPVLGSRLELSVSILGQGKEVLDPACFRLVRPAGSDDLPWVKQADLRLVPGQPAQLKIVSQQVLRDPVLRLAIHLACGHEVYREYTLLASPDVLSPPAPVEAVGTSAAATSPKAVRPRRPAGQTPVRKTERRVVRQEVQSSAATMPNVPTGPVGDQLVLSSADVGELPLRISSALQSAEEASETQREMLRLEFRMLQALHEQASGQLAMAEKLRAMESALGELQGRAQNLTERASGQQPVTAPQPAAVSAEKAEARESDSGWWFYGLLLGLALGLVGWLVFRSRRNEAGREDIFPNAAAEHLIDAPRKGELDEFKGGVDLPLEPASSGAAAKLDVELGGGEATVPPAVVEKPLPRALPGDSVLSINATTLDEHFEANPVMELADIMLSFGRVKGAAQALQEYIDNNPQEALQPWIRLMDVYRMAGMREEFEAVARNLNQHFNVEVQSWSEGKSDAQVDLMLDGGSASVAAPRAQSLEDMPRIIGGVVKMWDAEDVVGYLYELLRDNRGGQRQGFSLPVVEDILFLIELKETSNRMEKEVGKVA